MSELLRVQFIHGLEGSPFGTKAQYLAAHFDGVTPTMDPSDFWGCVETHTRVLQERMPDVLVGSSFGGAVAVALLDRGVWKGPTLLLAQGSTHFGGPTVLPEGVTVWLVHGVEDDVVKVEDSRALARTGTRARVRLIEVHDDHGLGRSTAAGTLAEWVEGVHAADAS